MLKKLLLVLGVIIGLIFWLISRQIGQEIGKVAFNSSSIKEEFQINLIKGFEKSAKQINSTTPIMIDTETRMDRVTVGPDIVFIYHYTLVNYNASQINSNRIQSDLRNSVKASVCASKEMKASLEYGGKYKYSYSGKDGQTVGSFVIDGNDCGYTIQIP
jgi:hypothetical protein